MGKTELFPSLKSMGLVYMYNILLLWYFGEVMGKTELFTSLKSMGLVYMYNILLCQKWCCGILER